MAESWATLTSYRLHDLLMFSVDTYYRLFELVNRRWWPAPLVGGLLAAALLATAYRRRAARLCGGLLALALVAVALLYFHEGFAAIHWLGPWWLGAFLLQAAICLITVARVQQGFEADGARRVMGLLLMTAATAWPLWALAVRPTAWQAEVVGLAPDPTVLLALGWLLCIQLPRPVAAALLVLPLVWCLFSGATLWAMQQPHALALPIAGLAGLAGLTATGVVWRAQR
jgi:Family of unknown function (DUF6064)